MIDIFARQRLSGGPLLIIIVIVLAILAFEISMFVSVIRNQRITANTKALWIIGMLILHPFVAIAYYFTEYKKS